MTRNNAELHVGSKYIPLLFHGTNADLPIGHIITPQVNGSLNKSAERDSTSVKDTVPETVDRDLPHAWATSKPSNARFYAKQRALVGGRVAEGSEPRLYVVEPLNPEDVLREPTGVPGEFASPSGFKVVDKI